MHSSIKKRDSIIVMAYCFLFFGIVSLLVHVAALFWWPPFQWWSVELPVVIIQLLIIRVGWWICHYSTLVDPDKVAVRQILGPNRLFTDCRIFSHPKLTRIVMMPGSQRIETTGNRGEPHAVFSLMEQTVDINGVPETRSDLQFAVIKVVYHLDVFENPDKVIQVFFREFRKAEDTDHMLKVVKDQVLSIVTAVADEVHQQTSIETYRTNARAVNNRLKLDLQDPLSESIGVVLDEAVVETVEDEIPGVGFLSELSRKNRAEQKSSADQAIARAEKDSAIAIAIADRETRFEEAEQNKLATIKEAAVRAEVAQALLNTLVAETLTTAQKELRDQQLLIQLLKIVDGQQVNVLIAQLAQLSPDQISAFINEVASKSGIQTKGGAVVAVGTGLAEANGVVAWAEGVKRFLDTINNP